MWKFLLSIFRLKKNYFLFVSHFVHSIFEQNCLTIKEVCFIEFILLVFMNYAGGNKMIYPYFFHFYEVENG